MKLSATFSLNSNPISKIRIFVTMATGDANFRQAFPLHVGILFGEHSQYSITMGIVFSFCFGESHNITREDDYRIDEVEQRKTYSWDKKDKIDPKQFMFDGLRDQTIGKQPGEINGQQFIIQNCQNCNIYLFDHSATVTIDDCSDCKIFIGPCKGSVFLRDCNNLQLAIICQQFRTRDCKNFDIYLFCQTQPIIESSQQMRFGCLQVNYNKLESQFESSNLSIFNNCWSKVHDFTPAGGTDSNFSLSPQTEQAEIFAPSKNKDELSFLDVHVENNTSLIPLTLGKAKRQSKENCFLLVFPESDEQKSAKFRCQTLIRDIQHQENCFLATSTEIKMQPSDVERICGSKHFNEFTKFGDVVGLEFCGANIAQMCKDVIAKNSLTTFVHFADGETGASQLKNFNNFIEMQTSV